MHDIFIPYESSSYDKLTGRFDFSEIELELNKMTKNNFHIKKCFKTGFEFI